MDSHFVEATNGVNWGKFMVGRFGPDEWARRSQMDGRGLIGGRGWSADHLLVFDLQTGEGALFRPGGSAASDLRKHHIWVCPLFEPFLSWLYVQDLRDLKDISAFVELPGAPAAMYGYRRPGSPSKETIDD